jgi:hypothetical protein
MFQAYVKDSMWWRILKFFRECLDPSNFQKFYKIPCHIESLDAYMEY